MNIFDIVGPIMVGPSSSHTAGAARIGYTVRVMLGTAIKRADIYFHGSFAQTYQGHGSDKAVIGGLLGYRPDDARIKYSMEHAEEAGLSYSFNTINIPEAHPNTIYIEAESEDGQKITVQGASVGGGNIIIQKFNGIEVDFTGDYDTLIVEHVDALGAVATVTNFLALMELNIANMKVFRAKKGGLAVMVIEADGEININLSDALKVFKHVTAVRCVKKIG